MQTILQADGSTVWLQVKKTGLIHIAAVDDFGGGTLALEQEIKGTDWPIRDSDNSDAAITWTSAFDESIQCAKDDKIRLTLTGSTSPDLKISITGDIEEL